MNMTNMLARSTTRYLAGTALALALGAAAAMPASASTVAFSNILGTWQNVLTADPGDVNITDNGTANPVIRWGVPSGGSQSGYNFDAVGSASVVVPPSPSPKFVLGSFTHVNQPIQSGTSITGVDLALTADVTIDAILQGNLTFLFHFDHDETPNGDDPCKYGGANNQGVNINGCADRVKVNVLSGTDSFLVGGDLYTINVIGFELPMTGIPVSQFLTKEQADNTADLIAQVQLTSSIVPEPSTWAMLGIGFLGLGALGFRRKRALRSLMAD